jgi:poly(3-hydroxybutyrate) depolymerase
MFGTMQRSFPAPVILFSVLLAACGVPSERTGAALPRLAILRGSLTVSGLSSGGYMATQYQVAYSKAVAGAGIVGAGPWFCAQGMLARAWTECLKGTAAGPDVTPLAAIARTSGLAGAIDDPAGLADDRVWVFHGSRDRMVGAAVSDALVRFYREFVPPDRIRYETQLPAGHGFPTEGAGVACGESASPWVNDCGYDAAGEMLRHLYDGLEEPAGTEGGELIEFDQSRYVGGGKASLDERGLLFVPASCAAGEACRLHVAFHGCGQGVGFVGRAFASDAGYNRWAAANRIVVLFPQAAPSRVAPFNPQGCWDWWGYSGPDYASRNGAQLAAVRRMVAALGAGT